MAPTAALFAQPRHPYTEALLSAVLLPDPSRRNTTTRIHLEGSVADPANPPSGCAFHPRCRYAQDRCRIETPALRRLTFFNLGEATPPGGHAVACHLAEELTLRGVTFFNLGEATPPGFNLGEATPPGPVASLSPTPT
jgi:peptide/nickel transport system ATP-binding protein